VKPVIVGATGTISKSFIKYLNNTTGGQWFLKKLQRTATLNTAHMLRKVACANATRNNVITIETFLFIIFQLIAQICYLFIYKQHIKTFVSFKLIKLLLHVSVTD